MVFAFCVRFRCDCVRANVSQFKVSLSLFVGVGIVLILSQDVCLNLFEFPCSGRVHFLFEFTDFFFNNIRLIDNFEIDKKDNIILNFSSSMFSLI